MSISRESSPANKWGVMVLARAPHGVLRIPQWQTAGFFKTRKAAVSWGLTVSPRDPVLICRRYDSAELRRAAA